MNAVEHIVESYYRYCRQCFTISDVKVKGGNNRQFDLLAYNLNTGNQYHIESSVTHQASWQPTITLLTEWLDKKFRGVPPTRQGANTDSAKGKSYLQHINNTYKHFGYDPKIIHRVFVIWNINNQAELKLALENYEKKHGLAIEIISLRDEIIPQLLAEIATSNYDDEVLRTLSLLRQQNLQTSSQAK